MEKLNLAVLLCFICVSKYQCAPESGCVEISRFEYEYKVLQKLAQLEASEEGLLTKIRSMIEELTNYVQDVEELKKENKLLNIRLELLEANVQSRDKLEATLETLLNTSVGFKTRLRPNPKYSTGQTVVFDEIVTNAGQSYNADTGVFTAPVNGQYLFSITIFVYNRYVVINIMKNDQIIGRVHPDGRNAPTYDTASVTSIVDLEKGDRVYARHERGDGPWTYSIYGEGWTSFTGTLIKPYLLL